MMSKVCFIQPILAGYRDPIFRELNQLLDNSLMVCAAQMPKEFGDIDNPVYEIYNPHWKKFWIFQYMPLKSFFTIFKSSERFVHFCDFKFLSVWALLVCCFFSKKKLWLHGQGGYKRSGLIHKWVYTLSVIMADGYICYTDYSAKHLKTVIPQWLHKKVHVVSNTLSLEPATQVNNQVSNSLLYMGRLRNACGIELLLEAAAKLDMEVRVIGHGTEEFLNGLKAKYPNATFFGSIFDFQEQIKIANSCLAGVYGGDAGLSVVHYMALGLPVIVHNDIGKHMGPEPSYVEDGFNGLNFIRGDGDSLATKILALKNSVELRRSLAEGALTTFRRLMDPTMAQKFAQILESR